MTSQPPTVAEFRGRRRRRPPLVPAASIALAVALLALLVYGQTTSGTDNTIDGKLDAGGAANAPGFNLEVLAGGQPDTALKRALADGRLQPGELRGRPSVINFWASWCPPCRTETPLLERAWKAHRERVRFVGLNMQDVRSDAKGFIDRLGVTYPQIRDGTDTAARRWEVRGLPETFFLDRRGRIVAHVVGAIDREELARGLSAARSGRTGGAIDGGAQRETR